MEENSISHLLTLCDLDYLKPILMHRFKTVEELGNVDLKEIGIQNEDHRAKLRYLLQELQSKSISLNHCNPILSFDDSYQILTRIDNEANLVSSCLHYLFNHHHYDLSNDDITNDTEYRLCRQKIDQVLSDVEKLQNNTERLIERMELPYLRLNKSTGYQSKKHSFRFVFNEKYLLLLSIALISVGLVFCSKQK